MTEKEENKGEITEEYENELLRFVAYHPVATFFIILAIGMAISDILNSLFACNSEPLIQATWNATGGNL